MQCTKCQSENTQKLQVVFEGGTSAINTRSNSAGAGIGGGFGIGGIVTKTSGTSQTALGKKASPPAKKPYKWAALAIFIGLVAFSSSKDTAGWGAILFGLLLMAGGGYYVYVASKFNKNEWPPLYKYWEDSWLCHKCGSIYHHA